MPILRQLENLLILLPHVLRANQPNQIILKLLEFKVNLAVVVGQNGYAVCQLEGVGVGCVVDEDHVLQISVYYS